MTKKEEFKAFVSKNPRLINYVKSGEMTWQKFYEIYDLYGENKEAWKDYLEVAAVSTATSTSLLSILKNIDLDSVQNGVNSIQRVVGLLQEMGGTKEENSEYKPRPIYKSFDD